MKMTRCQQKHLYDADEYKTCPYCSGVLKADDEQDKAPRKAKVVKVRPVRARRSSDAAVKAEEKKAPEVKAAPKAEEKKAPEVKAAPKAEEKKAPEVKAAPKAE